MIRPRSAKRAKQEREYAKLRIQFLIENPTCGVNDCLNEATEIHHKRGRIAELLTNTNYFLPVCRFHHMWIEAHPQEAKMRGYSLSRL